MHDVSPSTLVPSALPKLDLLGVGVNPTHYEEVVDHALSLIRSGRSGMFDFMPVHGLITAARDRRFMEAISAFDVIAPDGQPVRWGLNLLHRVDLQDRVYGPTCMMRLCQAAEVNGIGIYLYGATPEVLRDLESRLLREFPKLIISGVESPPFRPLTEEEDAAAVERINSSGAGMLFLGIGCPKQEYFAFEHRDQIKPVQFCVGAAFDFHAGAKKTAPAWMQKRGLEWLFRLVQEPRRLAKRYVVTNTLYIALLTKSLLTRRRRSHA
jgi:N-acetylglucosaminyldiphosphoundecaprenol N-acetyl-beta-D-mannosaminyltransferase